MSSEHDTNGGDPGKPSRARYDWTDPNVPAGDSPRHPTWPLVLGAGVWILWIGFVVAMWIVRVRSPVG